MKPYENSQQNLCLQVKALLEGGTSALGPLSSFITTEATANSPGRVHRGAAHMRKALSPPNMRRASSALTDCGRRLGVGSNGDSIDEVFCIVSRLLVEATVG